MILAQITPDQILSLITWVLGGFCGLALTLLVYIGNAGSGIKKSVAKLSQEHGERIKGCEVGLHNMETTAIRIESTLVRIESKIK